MNFFSELKRRNVIKVALAYVIVGWLIMQVGEVMAPALHLPDWSQSFVAFLLILGFPVALIFAWAFEMTPEGLKKEKDVVRADSITPATGRRLDYAIIALLVLAVGYFAYDKFVVDPKRDTEMLAEATSATPATSESSAPVSDRRSIAVLPFMNRSANEENAAFFSDGMHDELLTNLSKIDDLKVISRTSVMGYRDTTKNMRQIGEELGVATLLEGGVQRAGDHVRINVQLIDAATDEHLWADIYDRQLSTENIFAIQSEIARAIADALQATLSPTDQSRMAAQPTENLEAYDEYLVGTYLFNQSTFDDIREALAHARRAIELDPSLARAHVLKARALDGLIDTGAATLVELGEEIKAALDQALALDPNHGMAHLLLANYLWRSGQDGAREQYEKALALDPHNPAILIDFADHLRQNRDPDGAVALYEIAREIDPRSVHVLFGLARSHMVRGEFATARGYFKAIRDIDPRHPQGNGPTAGAFLGEGELAKSSTWLYRHMDVDDKDPELPAWITRMYLSLGDPDAARQWQDWAEASYDTNVVNVSTRAMLEARAGDMDQALRLARQNLEAGVTNRWSSDMMFTRVLQLQANATGDAGPALDVLKVSHPTFFSDAPDITIVNMVSALNTVQLLQLDGQDPAAGRLLEAVVRVLDEPYGLGHELQNWRRTARAEALALSGDAEGAVDELERISDMGWRLYWSWQGELNPNFASIHDHPGFLAIMDRAREDMEKQRQELAVLIESGEFPSQPGPFND